VAELEAEQALIAMNRELIDRFEQKIQATIARVWGEAAPLATEARGMKAAAELADHRLVSTGLITPEA
jgi:hypothetical protein